MGEQDVLAADPDALRRFTKALLEDVHALEKMLNTELFERGVRRIGAELEMFLVDKRMGPAPVAQDVLVEASDPRLTNELARFNVEANLTPLSFGNACLRKLHAELDEMVAITRSAAHRAGADVVLTGTLPTLRKGDLSLSNMTPAPRFAALNRALTALRGGEFSIHINGVDALEVTHDNVMLESCNTSFQLHFQVSPEEFARLYNVAQLVTAPVLAAAVNSPFLLGRRLWQETRVALFQQAVDARSSAHQARGLSPRVSFGDSWVDQSVLEIFKEDITRYRVVLGLPAGTDSLAEVEAGRAPGLAALRLHNGTVYRWNRPCYGVVDGVAHLRIENRVLPAGPTVIDMVSNAAFFFGLMAAVTEEFPDVREKLKFAEAKANFLAAARHGLQAQFRWVDGKSYTAASLINDVLIPMAEKGLRTAGIETADIDEYLGLVRDRVTSGQTGAAWALGAVASKTLDGSPPDVRFRAAVAAMIENQRSGRPVHTWPEVVERGDDDWRRSYRTVGQFMTTDLFTVRPHDLVDLAAAVMDWKHVRHVPVEDDQGHVVGILSHRALLRLVSRGGGEPVAVADIMKREPITVRPDTTTLEAMRLMRQKRVSCLLVTEAETTSGSPPARRDADAELTPVPETPAGGAPERLVGIITEADLIEVSAQLLERALEDAH